MLHNIFPLPQFWFIRSRTKTSNRAVLASRPAGKADVSAVKDKAIAQKHPVLLWHYFG
jgi:hypothetical protein